MSDILNKWDKELTVGAVVSKLLHLPPTEKNYIQGVKLIKSLIKNYVKKRTK